MVHLLHRLYGVDAPDFGYTEVTAWSGLSSRICHEKTHTLIDYIALKVPQYFIVQYKVGLHSMMSYWLLLQCCC